MKPTRKSVQIRTRKIDRMVARNNMKKAGLVSINKKKSTGESYFSTHWREAVVVN